MNVSESEARELLAAVRKASEQAAASRAKADEDSAIRRDAVKAAMDAGLPREQIAEAAGAHRNRLYRIVQS
jgi:hypothetical protein